MEPLPGSRPPSARPAAQSRPPPRRTRRPVRGLTFATAGAAAVGPGFFAGCMSVFSSVARWAARVGQPVSFVRSVARLLLAGLLAVPVSRVGAGPGFHAGR